MHEWKSCTCNNKKITIIKSKNDMDKRIEITIIQLEMKQSMCQLNPNTT